MTNLMEAGRGEALAAMGEDERRLSVRVPSVRQKFVEISPGNVFRLLTHAEYDVLPHHGPVVREGGSEASPIWWTKACDLSA